MKNIALKQVHFEGVTMQVPQIWDVETETYDEADGTKSYGMSINATGRDIRSIDISWGKLPEGTNAYTEACATYEEVIREDDLSSDDEPIICFDFRKHEAFGFNVWTDDGLPCFFFCVETPVKGVNNLLTVLVSAPDNEGLKDLMDFTEEYLSAE